MQIWLLSCQPEYLRLLSLSLKSRNLNIKILGKVPVGSLGGGIPWALSLFPLIFLGKELAVSVQNNLLFCFFQILLGVPPDWDYSSLICFLNHPLYWGSRLFICSVINLFPAGECGLWLSVYHRVCIVLITVFSLMQDSAFESAHYPF